MRRYKVDEMNGWQWHQAMIDKAFTSVAESVATSRWQSKEADPRMQPLELTNVYFEYQVPTPIAFLQDQVKPNLPWAEDHFRERISGIAHNPPPSHSYWPFRQNNNDEHMEGEKFSHTYPERFWPRYANEPHLTTTGFGKPNTGIRYDLGDLDTMIAQLISDPYTRQAYLPIWFPEDTGLGVSQRVPCTLGYHFLYRKGELDITYYMRSCDYMRHFADDVYMACRLLQEVARKMHSSQELTVRVGTMRMHIVSFHVFQGDLPILEMRIKANEAQ